MVDTTSRPTGGGQPSDYFDQTAVEQGMPEDTQQLVREYDSSWEFVTVLLKSQRLSEKWLKLECKPCDHRECQARQALHSSFSDSFSGPDQQLSVGVIPTEPRENLKTLANVSI